MLSQLRMADVAAIHEHADGKARELVPPFSCERIDSKTDGVNFRIADGRDDRIATCYEQEHAEAIVSALNKMFPV